MAKKLKVTVTLDPTLVAQVKALSDNFSQYVEETLWDQVRRDYLALDIERYEAEHGPIPEEGVRRAEAELFPSLPDRPLAA